MKRALAVFLMLCLVLSLCGCAKEEKEVKRVPETTEAEEPAYVSREYHAQLSRTESEDMINHMCANRAFLTENRYFCFEFDDDQKPVFAQYEVLDNRLARFDVMVENCIPEFISLYEGRVYYINSLEGSVESIDLEGNDRQVIISGGCDWLQLSDGKLYYCDESGRYCRAELDGSGATVLMDESVYYPYYMDGVVLYQSELDGESLHLRWLSDGADMKLTDAPSYAPVILDDTIYYTQNCGEFNRICSIELGESPAVKMYDMPEIHGAAEFFYDMQSGWRARYILSDGSGQAELPVDKLGGGRGQLSENSAYMLCDYVGEGIRTDVCQGADGRVNCFVMDCPDGTEVVYFSGKSRK